MARFFPQELDYIIMLNTAALGNKINIAYSAGTSDEAVVDVGIRLYKKVAR